MMETRLAVGLATLVLTSLLSSCGRQATPTSEESTQTEEAPVVKNVQDGTSSQPMTRIHFSDAAAGLAANAKVCAASCSSLKKLSVATTQDKGVVQLAAQTYTAIELSINGKLHTLQLDNAVNKVGKRREILVDVVNGVPNVTEASFPADITDVVLIQPKPATKLVMSSGMEVLIPAQSVSKPTFLGIDKRSGGMPVPGYQFWPELQLEKNKKAKISFRKDAFDKISNKADFVIKSPGLSIDLDRFSGSVELDKFNNISIVPRRDFAQTEQGIQLVPEVPTKDQTSLTALELSSDPCAQKLSEQLDYYKSVLETNGSLRISACEDIFPHIHIIVADLNRVAYKPDIAYDPVEPSKWRLRRIDDHGGRSQQFVTINGFNFAGNEGRIYEPYDIFGFPISTVVSDGVQLQERSDTEAILMFYKKTTTGTKTRFRPDPEDSLRIETGNATDGTVVAAVGSGTSIVANNVCSYPPRSGDGPFEISALGMGNGRMVFISSARKYGTPNTNQVYSGDLCNVFKALNAGQGAIRLDSGSAAQLAYRVNGEMTLLNPHLIGSFERTAYGVSRRVAYGVGVRKTQ